MEKTPIDYLKQPFLRFFQQETSSGVLLLTVTVIALLIANTGFYSLYYDLLHVKLTVSLGSSEISKSLILWINDGLMAVFFFVIGLEIKREFVVGELSEMKKAALPVVAALGGMVIPALIYTFLNIIPEASDGWAIPMAADIAFTLGILQLLGKRVPYGLKVFLTVFAISDDLGSIVVIAFFYTPNLKPDLILIAVSILAGLFVLMRLKLYSKYFFLMGGIVIWFLLLKSGVHATIAGVLMAMVIPIRSRIDVGSFSARANDSLRRLREVQEKDSAGNTILSREELGAIDNIESLTEKTQSPLQFLENNLHGWVAFFIMPVFAFANAGVVLTAGSFNSLSVSVALALLFGNCTGISLTAWLAIKLKFATLPEGVSFRHIMAVSLLGGVGFTMSLFITNLAFDNQAFIDSAKIGIMAGSLMAGILGYIALRLTLPAASESED
jgi:Na+:H+ antiporter, NhaA family